jgi:hypothetical protein
MPAGNVCPEWRISYKETLCVLIYCNEIKPDYLTGLTFHYVDDIKDVLKIALE